MELNRKLPFFMRGKCAEGARISEAGERPKVIDFLKFEKDRAELVSNKFGDLILSFSREKKQVTKKGKASIKVDIVDNQG